MTDPITPPTQLPNADPIPMEQFVSAMHEAVAERGRGWVYPEHWRLMTGDDREPDYGMCMYVHRDERGNEVAGCLIAVALEKCGVTLDVLSAFEGTPGPDVCYQCRVEGLYLDDKGEVARTPLGLGILGAQGAQDGNCPWGTAIDRFDAHLSLANQSD